MGNLFLTKEARIYSRAKTPSSINDAEKSGQLHVKKKKEKEKNEEIRALPNTIHKRNSKG